MFTVSDFLMENRLNIPGVTNSPLALILTPFSSVKCMEMANCHETNGGLGQQVNCNNNKRHKYNTHRAIKNNAS